MGGAHTPQQSTYPNLHNLWIFYLGSKRDFTDVTKLKILIGADDSGLSIWVQCNYKGAHKENRAADTQRRERGPEAEKKMQPEQQKSERETSRCHTAGFVSGAGAHEPRNADSL